MQIGGRHEDNYFSLNVICVSTVQMEKNNVIYIWRHYDVTSFRSTAIYRILPRAKAYCFAITIKFLERFLDK